MESSEKGVTSEEILIVEDSPTQAENLKFLLEEKNFHVSVAYNGKEALAFLLDKPRPAIIISDIVMPEMDGYQLCRRIKENKDLKDIPFILLTALSDPRDIIKGLECGADNFITKPYDEKYLLARIQYVFANKVIRETDKVQTGVEIFFGGQKYYITAERQQILSLLLSTYETAVQTNIDLAKTQDELRELNEKLKEEIAERKRTEEALKESEKRLVRAQHIARMGFLDWNLKTNEIYLSDEVYRMYGLVREGVLTTPDLLNKVVHPDDLEFVGRNLELAIRDVQAYDIDHRVARPDGGIIWVHAQAELVRGADGKPERLLGTVLDITERKQTEEKVSFLASIVESSSDAIIGKTPDGTILTWNLGAQKMYGYSADEVIGRSISILVPPDHHNEIQQFLETIKQGKRIEQYETVRIRKNGEKIDISLTISPLKDKAGNIIGASTIARDVTERKKVEKERSRLIAIIEATSDFVSTGYSDGRVLYYNKAARRMLGIGENEEISNIRISDTHPEWAKEIILKEGIPTAIREGIWSGETALLTRDGREIPVSQVIISHRTPDGNVDYLSTIMRDIAERKRAEEALRQSEEKYRTLTEAAQEAIFIIDRDDKIEFVNKFAANMLSLSPQEIIGKSRYSLFPSDISKEQKRDLQQIFVTGMSDHYETKVSFPKYEMWLDTQLVPLKNEAGEVNAVLGISRDITERKNTEETLRHSELKYRTLTEAAQDAIFIINRDDIIEFVNNFGANMLRLSPQEIIGKPRHILFPSETSDEQKKTLQNIFKTGITTHQEIKAKFFKSEIWLDNQLVPLKNEAGEVYAVLGISRDITKRKLAEEKLSLLLEELKRSNTELEQFAYIASHDLQEPLRMVGSYVQLIERRYKGKLDPEADEFIAFASDGAKRMQNMINDLLQYSRVTTRGKPFERTDCQALLDSSCVNLKVAIEESNAVITHDPLPVVFCDASQLDRVFQNLLGNAIKFRGENPPRIHIGVEKKGADWVFSVKDNGIGFDMQQADRLFNMFQRLQGGGKYPGTGMGLAICRKIVERHGGRIWVESKPGEGSTFFFAIPIKGGDKV